MKKKFLSIILILFVISFTDAIARDDNAKPIRLENKDINRGHSGASRMPGYVPTAFLDGNTLTFDATCIGSVISLVQDGAIVYSAIIDEDCTIILPDYLSGIFELQLQRGSITFVGEIEL